MRGSRCKALKREFKATFGRPVYRTRFVSQLGGVVGYIPSEWRRLKVAYMRSRG